MSRYATVRSFLLALVGLLLLAPATFGQAVTTSTVVGRVVDDENGQPLAGVQIMVRNQATGVVNGTTTGEDGRFVISGLRPGGPYLVEARLIGYRTESIDAVQLDLGEREDLQFELAVEAVTVEEIRVTARVLGEQVSGGVASVVQQEDIANAPTLGRDLADFVRFTPQAIVQNADDDGPSVSIAGQNNRYNSMYIDGAVNNDVFGLSAQGTNGGQTGATPISMDAIEEFQIAISPFNVTQSGFTGGAINAITRSGTNTFTGSAFYQLRNESFAGKTPTENPDVTRRRLPDFTTWRAGFRFGGPIVQNKAFFFLNGELLRSTTPRPFDETYIGDSAGQLDELSQFLIDEAGYDPGGFGDKESFLDDEKVLGKIDWNLNDDHRLTVRHSYSHSENVDAFDSGVRTIEYSNTSEVFPNTTNSTAVELNSRLGNDFANKLILGATFVRDDRDIAGEPFPHVHISDGAGTIHLGPEPFSTANILNQDVFTLTDNFNWYRGKHTLTFGTNFEFYDIANLFIPFNFGWYFFFGGMEDFMEAVETGQAPFASGVLRGWSLVGDPNRIGDESENIGAFKAYQIGFYAQDQIDVSDRLDLTLGLRVDVPKITTTPRFAPDVFDTTIPAVEAQYDLKGAAPGETPDALPYFQPRFGFNYDAARDGSTRLRGGAGVFLGRVPFVWPGGMFLNNGANTGVVERFFTGGIPFRPDPTNGVTNEDFGASSPIPSGRLEIFEEGYRYPTVFRTSLGVDHLFASGFLAILEAQYTKTLDNFFIENVNLNSECARQLDGPDTRTVFACEVDGGQINGTANLIDDRYTNIHRVGSTSEGYTYDISAQLRKEIAGHGQLSVAYTYGDAKSIFDGTSSQLNSNWRFREIVSRKDFDLSRSDFSLGSRVLAQFRWRQEFIENLATTISLVYTGESGRPFSYIIDESEFMMGEVDSDNASLLYVPTDASELMFDPILDSDDNVVMTAAQQAAEFDEFIDGIPALRENRGRHVERNNDRTPFENVIDLRAIQEFSVKGQNLAVTLDVFNFTNLLNNDWGRRWFNIFSYSPIEFQRFDTMNGNLTPVYQFFDDDINSKSDLFDQFIHDAGVYSSRWQLQLGVRYSF